MYWFCQLSLSLRILSIYYIILFFCVILLFSNFKVHRVQDNYFYKSFFFSDVNYINIKEHTAVLFKQFDLIISLLFIYFFNLLMISKNSSCLIFIYKLFALNTKNNSFSNIHQWWCLSLMHIHQSILFLK